MLHYVIYTILSAARHLEDVQKPPLKLIGLSLGHLHDQLQISQQLLLLVGVREVGSGLERRAALFLPQKVAL